MKILYGTILPQETAPEELPESPAGKGFAALAVPGPLLFASAKGTRRLANYLKSGGRLLATEAVEPGTANQIFLETRAIRIAFVREFRAWCRKAAELGVREIVLPVDVTVVWRKPAVFAALHALLGELAGVLLKNRLFCRLPLDAPQSLNASRLAEFHRMLVPGAYSWLLTGRPEEAAAKWSEPLRFYADNWSFPAESSHEACEAFLQCAGRCAASPVTVWLPRQTTRCQEPDLLKELPE